MAQLGMRRRPVRMFCSDLDGTLVGNGESTRHFRILWESLPADARPLLVYSSGRLIDDNLALQSLVAAGLGISLVPSLVLSFLQHPDIAVVRLKKDHVRRIDAYTWSDLTTSPVIEATLRALQNAARSVGDGLQSRVLASVGHPAHST